MRKECKNYMVQWTVSSMKHRIGILKGEEREKTLKKVQAGQGDRRWWWGEWIS